ncbi:MAG TPA: FAD-dependent oxidoreductase [Rhizobiales bacterium]|nr:D-amino acid dehydrogenase small subunit [bacterium BMS3Bbin10]HDO52880.1 FAD-dependent oxidoreductase [Hyphomicrobiales bacterium]
MSDAKPREVIVIGAGIVGICCALALREKGFDVRVIDRDGAGEGASFGNAGIISPWSCVPQSLPGVWKNVPKWLLDPEGPLAVRWSYTPRLAPWLLKFFRAGTFQRLPAIADAMLAVNRPSADMYHRLLAGTGEEGLVRDCLYLHVYRDIGGADPEDLPWRLRAERGVPFEVLTGGEVQEVEPELSPEIKSAMAVKRQARTVNPGRLRKVLAAMAEARGARFLRGTVEKIVPDTDGGYLIDTGQGAHSAKTVILAAGAWSARLLAGLGVRVPLEAERGYHLVFKDPGLPLAHSIMDTEHKFAISSMEMGVRAAGTAEFAGLDAPPNYRRARIFKRHAKTLLPNLNTGSTDEWMGTRPSSPDSVPFIGEVPGHPRLFCGFGHGHLGLTGAPMTGRMVAALAAGEPLNIDMAPYRLDRFNS